MSMETAEQAPSRYSDAGRAELVSALDELHGVHNAVLHEMLLITAELDRRNAYLEDGQRDVGTWLQMHLGLGRRTAQRWREASERIEVLPHLAESFSSGRLSFDKLAASLSHATPDNDEAIAKEAEQLDAALCERVARRRRESARTDEARAAASKRLTYSWADAGTRLDFFGSLTAEQGAALIAGVERVADSLPLRDAEGNLTSLASRRADALVMLAAATIADDQEPDRATVALHVDLDTLHDGTGVGEDDRGGIHSSDVLRRLACDARVQAVIENRHGEVVGISATTRTVPRHIRRQLVHRDRGTCRFPGCANRSFLDAHHLEWWSEGGLTEIKNLALFCRWHHRLFHEGGWKLRGDPDFELEFIKPNGEVLYEEPRSIGPETSEWLWNNLLGGRFGHTAERKRPPPEKTLSLN